MLESLFNKVAGLQTCNFIKERLQRRCFPVKFVKFLRTPILKNIWERLLLEKSESSIEFYRGLHKMLREIKTLSLLAPLSLGRIKEIYLIYLENNTMVYSYIKGRLMQI